MCANIPFAQNTCLFWRKFVYLFSYTARAAPDVRLVIFVLSCLNSDFPFLSTQRMSVGFIGAGQLTHALVRGFTAAGQFHITLLEFKFGLLIRVDFLLLDIVLNLKA